MLRRLLPPVMLALSLGCQTYDFEPVQPLAVGQTTQHSRVIAKALKPNVMILVDMSGSMAEPATAGGSTTRIADVRSAMHSFLTTSADVARFGLATFPAMSTGGQCAGTSSLRVDLPAATSTDDAAATAANEANSQLIDSKIQAFKETGTASSDPDVVGGGTPTGASLAFVGGLSQLNRNDDRADFVLVLTDGVPNCNATNENTCDDAAACRCTVTGGCARGAGGAAGTCFIGCLDRAGVVGQVQALRGKDIKTIVVGFGADTASGDGPEVLNAMAEAGGFPRPCPNHTNAECGANDTCNGGVCGKQFYQAASATELAAALRSISGNLGTKDPCVYPLASAPSDPRLLAVIIDGVHTPAGPDTWSYDAQQLTFLGALCTRVKNSSAQHPVDVEVREVDAL